MKTKNIFLTAAFAFSAATSQAGIIRLTTLTVAIPTAIYVGNKFCQSNGDLTKTQRLIRQDKDAACSNSIDAINKNCNNDLCKAIIKLLKQAKTNPSQKIEDLACEHTGKIIDAVTETDAYKATHKVTTHTYQAAKNAIDDALKPKK